MRIAEDQGTAQSNSISSIKICVGIVSESVLWLVMNMGNKAWKDEERRCAALFGGTRRPLSGNSTAALGAGDVRDCPLVIEVKSWKRMPLVKHIEKVKKEAEMEGKPWILAIHKKGSHERYGIVPLSYLAYLVGIKGEGD